MTREEKELFRKKGSWRRWRAKLKAAWNHMDAITLKPLTKTWNLHHLDMRDKNYTKITDVSRFLPLNEDTHKFIHWLYRLWKKDKKVLDRIKLVMEKMEEMNND